MRNSIEPSLMFSAWLLIVFWVNPIVCAVFINMMLDYRTRNKQILDFHHAAFFVLNRTQLSTLCGQVCQWLATDQWFSQSTLVSPTNKTDRHDITEILLKVALNTINSRPLPIIESVHKHYNYDNAFVFFDLFTTVYIFYIGIRLLNR